MNKFFIILTVLFLFTTSSFAYDYSSTKNIPIRLSITKEISTKMPIIEGQTVNFRILKDVNYGNLNLEKNSIVTGRIECIISNGMNGFPAEIILDNFEIPNIKKSQLISTYSKQGKNKAIWIYPLKVALWPFPFAGIITSTIKGGQASIKPTDVITIYYYPEWE